MRVGGFDGGRVLIIAEVGNNHEGDAALAAQLVRNAADAGVDAVKFQTFKVERFVSRRDTERYARMTRFELGPEQFVELGQLAQSLGLLFVSTPLDLGSVKSLEPVVDIFKIASGDNDCYPLIDAVARTGKPVIMSTGLSDDAQVRRSVGFLRERWTEHVQAEPAMAVLHCVSSYPTPSAEANLRSISYLTDVLGCEVGYSDHTFGLEAAVLAVAAGATIVEKHFTIDHHHSAFRDHQLSADLPEMRELVRRIREASAMLGRPGKFVQPSEVAGVLPNRRSIVASRPLAAGHTLALEDLMWLRPGNGLRPGEEPTVAGRVLRRAIDLGEPLQLEDLE